MAILLFILQLIGWVLLAVLALLILALLLPLGIQFAYRPDDLQIKAFYGPVKFTLWPRGSADEKPPAKKKAPEARAAPPAVTKTVEGEKASVSVKVEPDKAPPTEPAQSPATAAQEPPKAAPVPESASAEKTAPQPEAKDGLPFGISEHIDAALQLLSDEPAAFIQCMLGHTGWLGRWLLRTVRVRHLDVFWTVTAEEASATAELYGAEMAALNNLLALLQQYVRLQSDRLWLEPDYTGERRGERTVSFRMTIGTGVLLWIILRLLYRLWKDPQLQPAAKA